MSYTREKQTEKVKRTNKTLGGTTTHIVISYGKLTTHHKVTYLPGQKMGKRTATSNPNDSYAHMFSPNTSLSHLWTIEVLNTNVTRLRVTWVFRFPTVNLSHSCTNRCLILQCVTQDVLDLRCNSPNLSQGGRTSKWKIYSNNFRDSFQDVILLRLQDINL